MSEHYFVSDNRELLSQGRAILTGAEFNHLARVMRQKPGDSVLLFDGSGYEFEAVIETIGKNNVELSIRHANLIDREPEIDLTMAVALPKGDRQKWLIEKLTELGVSRFVPLRTARSEIKADENVLDRLRRQVIEASKQCGRLRLMEIGQEATREELAATLSEDTLPWITHPKSDGEFGQYSFNEFAAEWTRDTQHVRKFLIVVGPPGGLTADEVSAAIEDHWRIIDLGSQVYRTETAAMVAAALFLHL